MYNEQSEKSFINNRFLLKHNRKSMYLVQKKFDLISKIESIIIKL